MLLQAENYSTQTAVYVPSHYTSNSTKPKTYEQTSNYASRAIINVPFLKKEIEKMNNREKLKEFSDLSYNWNENGAEPFSPKLIRISSLIIEEISHQPEIFPTARQSIQFEYEKDNGDYLEFEIFEDRVEYLLINDVVGEKDETFSLDMRKIDRIVSEFYG